MKLTELKHAVKARQDYYDRTRTRSINYKKTDQWAAAVRKLGFEEMENTTTHSPDGSSFTSQAGYLNVALEAEIHLSAGQHPGSASFSATLRFL